MQNFIYDMKRRRIFSKHGHGLEFILVILLNVSDDANKKNCLAIAKYLQTMYKCLIAKLHCK